MKTIYIPLSVCLLASVAQAQVSDVMLDPGILSPLEQETHQQLIGYALEVKNALIEQEKPLGKYLCTDIFATDGYPSVGDFPCEAIVHSEDGPIVVRYKNIDQTTNEAIITFLRDTPLKDPTYYNNGRFRFTLE